MTSTDATLRFDLGIIASWIEPRSRVLDLGCGKGELLYFLKHHKQVKGFGIEKVEARAAHCIEIGLSVVQGGINAEIGDYPDDSFDYIVLSQTLQQVYQPARLLDELLRVGRYGIVSFPNFSHWAVRLQLMFGGYAPKTSQLPYEWHNTPNIRVITLKDFRKFVHDTGGRIIRETAINTPARDRYGRIVKVFSNWLATYGLFMIGRKTV